MMHSLIDWHPADEPPDDETTVLIAIDGGSEPVWFGFRNAIDDEECWFLADSERPVDCDEEGNPNGAKVTHWAHLPNPPPPLTDK